MALKTGLFYSIMPKKDNSYLPNLGNVGWAESAKPNKNVGLRYANQPTNCEVGEFRVFSEVG